MLLDFVVNLVCLAIFVGILGVSIYAFLATFASPGFRTLRRAIRRGRFGLKTGFAVMAVVAVTCVLLTMSGVEIGDPGIVCVLTVAVPFALLIVAFAALALSELFDTESTRNIVARRAQEDELTVYMKQRKEAAEQGTKPPPSPFGAADTERDEPGTDNT